MEKFIYKDLSIDFGSRLISYKDSEISLDPKAFNTLAYLIENRGRVVSNDELIQHIWDDRPTNTDVVTASVGRVRKIFKDSGIKSEVIRTAHKVGYQFVLAENDQSETIESSTKNPPPESFWYKVSIGLFISLLLMGALLAQQILDANTPTLANSKGISQNSEQYSEKASASNRPTEIFFIRHAEKESDGTDDPPLSQLGIARSARWKTLFNSVKFDEIHTTNFIRNTQTVDHVFGTNLENLHYYSALSFDIGAELERFSGKKIAIIGHSNTIPGMVNRLVTDTQYDAMDFRNYELIYQVIVDSSGGVSSNQLTLDYVIEQ